MTMQYYLNNSYNTTFLPYISSVWDLTENPQLLTQIAFCLVLYMYAHFPLMFDILGKQRTTRARRLAAGLALAIMH